MPPDRPSIIVFDLDGTLIEFRIELSEAKRRIVETMVARGMPPEMISVNDSIQTLLQRAKTALGDEAADELKTHVLDIMREYEMRAANHCHPRNGVAELLTRLRGAGYRLAVATNTHREAAILSLSKSGIIHLLEAIVTRDDVKNLKPRGDVLLKVTELMKTCPEKVLYVGDSIHDLHAAREAGILFVGVQGGFHTGDELRAAGCETVLSDLVELLSYLGLGSDGA